MPDSLITFQELGLFIKQICINENIIEAKFYKSQNCWKMDAGLTEMVNSVFKKCYIGQVDLRSKGLNWKYDFKENDIYFFNRSPVKLK